MLIEKTRVQARIFNLNSEAENEEYNVVLANPATRVLDKKWIKHTETEIGDGTQINTTENRVYLEWETCLL